VARNRRPLVNARPSADLEAAGLKTATQLQSALVCPLLYNERFIGTLSVYHVDAAFYRDDHRRLLDRVSEQAAAVINNSMLFEQTQEDSLTDPLTGLPEHALPVHAPDARAGARRAAEVRAVADGHGPRSLQGDQRQPRPPRRRPRALRVARVLRAAIRPYDICVRYAGDEFIVVCRAAGADEAEQKRQELQQASTPSTSKRVPASGCRSASASARRSSRTDGESYESLLATAGQPHVSGQGDPQAAQRPHRLAWPSAPECRGLSTSTSSGRERIV
jgi:GGDEF domain-containing protein